MEYLYRIILEKEQRLEVKRKHPNLAQSPVYIKADEWVSHKDLSQKSRRKVKKKVRKRLENVDNSDLPKTHELESRERFHLYQDYQDEPIVKGKVEIS